METTWQSLLGFFDGWKRTCHHHAGSQTGMLDIRWLQVILTQGETLKLNFAAWSYMGVVVLGQGLFKNKFLLCFGMQIRMIITCFFIMQLLPVFWRCDYYLFFDDAGKEGSNTSISWGRLSKSTWYVSFQFDSKTATYFTDEMYARLDITCERIDMPWIAFVDFHQSRPSFVVDLRRGSPAF